MASAKGRRKRKKTGPPAATKKTDTVGAWLRHAVAAMQLGVTITDVEGRILYTNPADARMHGYTVEDLLGQDVRIFAPAVHRERLSGEEMAQASRWEREALNTRRDGTTFPVRLLSDVLRDDTGQPVGLVTTCEDLSQRPHAVEQLRQAQKMEVLGQLTGGIAHDFNNVLTVILANLGLLSMSEPTDDDERDQLVAEALQVTRQGVAMARQLLAFSREDRLSFRALDLRKLVSEYARVLQRVLPESIEIRVTSEDELPLAHADRAAVQQVLLSLATNARDAMPEGGMLHLGAFRTRLDREFRATHGWGDPGDYVTLTVSDTGVGMDAATRRQVFNPFFTTKPAGRGTGLGLAMVYALMKQHRGFVHVYSEPDEGTTVKLWFPQSEESIEREGDYERGPAPQGGTETILVAEDEAPLRRAAQRVLSRYGYTVIVASDGEEALKLFEEHADEIDLVLSDLIMPRLGGKELRDAVLARKPDMPVVLASGYTASDLQVAANIATGDLFLQKPWTVPDLLMRVREALDRR